MSPEDLQHYIRSACSGSRCIDDLVSVSQAMLREGIGPNHHGIKRSDLGRRLGVELRLKPRTVFHHLTEANVTAELHRPAAGSMAVLTWSGELVEERDIESRAREAISNLLSEVTEEDIANALGIPKEEASIALQRGDPVRRLNLVVDSVDCPDMTGSGCGKIHFQNKTCRYRLRDWVVNEEEIPRMVKNVRGGESA